MAQKGTDLDSVSSRNSNRPKISDKIPVFKFPEKTWMTFRIFGPIFTYGGYWVKTKTKEGKASQFYTACPSYDPETQQRDSSIFDPWRELEERQSGMERDDKLVNFTTQGFMNAIFRKAQADAPRKQAKHTKKEAKSGFKDKDSDSFTPVVPLRLTYGAMQKLKEQAGLNTASIKGQTKAFSVTHEKYGCDVRIMYNPDKAPADQYQVSIGERKPLTEDELAYLKWDLSDLEEATSEDEVRRDFESWAKRNDVKIGKKKRDDDFDDEEDEPKSKKKKKPVDDEEDEPKSKKSAKGKKRVAEDDEDDDFDEEDEPKSKKKKKSVDDDEDDEDDEDDFDDDEEDDDDEPKSKKKKKPVVKSKKKKPVDDDDDEFDDDEEDEEPKSKSKKKKPVDDDDDEFDDEDEEDDEPKSKSKKKKPVDDEDDFDDEDEEDDEPKSKSKKKKPVDDEDDFDDDEEDDDDEPKSKKKKKPVVKSKKKKPVDDDDDEFDN